MIIVTSPANLGGITFDGVDLILSAPHVDIDSTEDDIKSLADKVAALDLQIGSVVAPVWGLSGGGSAMGNEMDRNRFVTQVRKSCHTPRRLTELGVRPSGVVRIDSSVDSATWGADSVANSSLIANTFRESYNVADDCREKG